jgi:hypothetical protein
MKPKIKIRVSKERMDAGLKDPSMKKAKGVMIEAKIREKGIIQKKK